MIGEKMTASVILDFVFYYNLVKNNCRDLGFLKILKGLTQGSS